MKKKIKIWLWIFNLVRRDWYCVPEKKVYSGWQLYKNVRAWERGLK